MYGVFGLVSETSDTSGSLIGYLGTLLAGLLTGAVGGALIAASHERAERFRERMIEAATNYLAAVTEYSAGLRKVQQRIMDSVRGQGLATAEDWGPAVVEQLGGNQGVRDLLRRETDTAFHKLRAAGRRLAIVFPRRHRVYDLAKALNKVLYEQHNRVIQFDFGPGGFGDYLEEARRKSREATDKFVDVAARAIRSRRL